MVSVAERLLEQDHDYHVAHDITVMECVDCITTAEPASDPFIDDMLAWAAEAGK